jgi:hypothetical protein
MEASGNSTRRPLYTPKKEPRNPLNRRLGGPHRRSEGMRKISPPPGFDPGTFQPVTSRYNKYARFVIICHFIVSNARQYNCSCQLAEVKSS